MRTIPPHLFLLLFALQLMACSSPPKERPNTKGQPTVEQLNMATNTVTTVEKPSIEVDTPASQIMQRPRSPYQELEQHRRPFEKDEIVAQFPSTDFTYAMVYALDPNKRNGAASVFKGRTGPSRLLSKTEVARFNTIVNAPKTYGEGPAGCFDPRVGLVYYDEDSLPVAHVSICFDCSQFKAYPKLQAQEQHEDYLRGLNEAGAVQLKYLLAEWGFPNTSFHPMSDGQLTLEYLKDVLPQVLEKEEARIQLERYKTLFEEHKSE